MAALCQRVSWHHVSLRFTPLRSGARSSQSWAANVNPGEQSWQCVRASREQESPFTEKMSVKRVRGGGRPSGVALKSLEFWSAEAAARAREAPGVSADALQSFSSITAEFRGAKDESSGLCPLFFS